VSSDEGDNDVENEQNFSNSNEIYTKNNNNNSIDKDGDGPYCAVYDSNMHTIKYENMNNNIKAISNDTHGPYRAIYGNSLKSVNSSKHGIPTQPQTSKKGSGIELNDNNMDNDNGNKNASLSKSTSLSLKLPVFNPIFQNHGNNENTVNSNPTVILPASTDEVYNQIYAPNTARIEAAFPAHFWLNNNDDSNTYNDKVILICI
jgi:hypothetical protein